MLLVQRFEILTKTSFVKKGNLETYITIDKLCISYLVNKLEMWVGDCVCVCVCVWKGGYINRRAGKLMKNTSNYNSF